VKITHEIATRVAFQSDRQEMDAAEPVMLIHLNQKLAFGKKGLALAFTSTEIGYLEAMIVRRATELGTEMQSESK
jgi:hypothetical protein